jgi:hypothetical protein
LELICEESDVNNQIEFILRFLKNNLPLIIAVSAFVLSFYQFIDAKIKHRVKLHILIDNAQCSVKDQDESNLLLSITIVNKSDSPLNITHIYFIDKDKEYLCSLKKQWSGEHYYPEFPETDIPRTERIFSTDFPITLQPNDAKSELVRFSVLSYISVKKHDIVKLRIATNKKAIICKLECCDDKQDLTYL